MENNFDVIIIGGGPAGLTAGLYTSRDRLKSLAIDKGLFGGLIASTELVENFPGFPEGISGMELAQKMHEQALKYGLNTINASVIGLKNITETYKTVITEENEYQSKVIIIASGSERAKLNIPGEEQFTGKGVSYCATCDGAFFRDQTVAVVGGGNAAISEAIHLTHYASNVIVIHRRNELRATRVLQEKAFNNPKIRFLWDTVVESIEGHDFVKSVRVSNVRTGEKSTLEISGIFIATGLKPSTDFIKGSLPLDEAGHIITNDRMETEIPGIYAAGDVRRNSGMQAITAAGEGATAAIYAHRFLSL